MLLLQHACRDLTYPLTNCMPYMPLCAIPTSMYPAIEVGYMGSRRD
jgi:hypothetical protein